MEQEIEQLILRAIMEYGYPAIPMDYSFLVRYGLLDSYFRGVDLSMQGNLNEGYQETVKLIVSPYLADTDFSLLGRLQHSRGKRTVLSLIYGNELYYKILKKELKNEFSKQNHP